MEACSWAEWYPTQREDRPQIAGAVAHNRLSSIRFHPADYRHTTGCRTGVCVPPLLGLLRQRGVHPRQRAGRIPARGIPLKSGSLSGRRKTGDGTGRIASARVRGTLLPEPASREGGAVHHAPGRQLEVPYRVSGHLCDRRTPFVRSATLTQTRGQGGSAAPQRNLGHEVGRNTIQLILSAKGIQPDELGTPPPACSANVKSRE